MTTIQQLRGPSGWLKSANCSWIQQLLRTERIIECIRPHVDGRVELIDTTWAEYWSPVAPAFDERCAKLLLDLEQHRRAYIASGHQLEEAKPYCQTYFKFLRHLLQSASNEHAVRKLVGLESFVICFDGEDDAAAGGTISIRHPVYLIAKLREPKAYDDPKFLAMIAPCHRLDEPSQLFFHYRQVKIGNTPSASMLVYPAVNQNDRAGSFARIETVTTALSHRPDPRSKQRGASITDWAVAPFLKGSLSQGTNDREIRLIDIGGGTGALLSAICSRLVAEHEALVTNRRFVWSIVDLGLQDASRRVNNAALRRHMSYLEYIPSDYMSWLEEADTFSPDRRAHVLLACRLFNNMSRFSIERSSDTDLSAQLTTVRGRRNSEGCHPADCLIEPDGDRLLVASNSRVRMGAGSTFRQASLSDYYQGLAVAAGVVAHDSMSSHELWYPYRVLEQDSLLMEDGRSIFNRMCKVANLVVIEDVDLTPALLKTHLKQTACFDLAASDATDRVRMQSARLTCVTSKQLAAHLPGRRIW